MVTFNAVRRPLSEPLVTLAWPGGVVNCTWTPDLDRELVDCVSPDERGAADEDADRAIGVGGRGRSADLGQLDEQLVALVDQVVGVGAARLAHPDLVVELGDVGGDGVELLDLALDLAD
jgi:hypothetical protein